MAKKQAKKAKPKTKSKDAAFRQFQYSRDIKTARKTLGFTLRAAATAIKLPITTLHWMEKGSHAPNVEAFAKTVSFYNLKPENYIR